jgi:hypothetical protein
MSRRVAVILCVNALLALGVVCSVMAQGPAGPGAEKGAVKGKGGKGKGGAQRPGLFLREEWKQDAKNSEHPVDENSIANSDLELKLYNSTGEGILMTGTAGLDSNPPHIWTGLCDKPCAATLRSKTNYADLTGLARIKATVKTSGLHQVHPMVKLADGTFLVADAGVGTFTDWLDYEFAVSDLRWLHLDEKRVVTTGTWVANPDLSKVDEIGFADLMPGSGHGAGGWSDVATVEVYAKPVPR